MIYSSNDIYRLLRSDAMIRQEASVQIVNGTPGLDVDELFYIYIDKYPTVEEFEATWRVWVLDNSNMGAYLVNTLTALLPGFDYIRPGLYEVKEFYVEGKTVVKPQSEIDREEAAEERKEFQGRFTALQKGLEERLTQVRDGLDGKDGLDGLDGRDGRDGRDGKDGRDGQDLKATDVQLFDLKDVEQSPLPFKKGQVLMFDGQGWTNLYVPQMQAIFAGGSGKGGDGGDGETVIIADIAPETREDGSALQDGDQWWSSSEGRMHIYYVDGDSAQWVQSSGDGGTGIEDAPNTGQFYVRKYGEWVRLVDALAELGITAP